MTKITIPDVDDRIVQGLKQIAWQQGLPLEEALRQLLASAVLDRSLHTDRHSFSDHDGDIGLGRKRDVPPFELCAD